LISAEDAKTSGKLKKPEGGRGGLPEHHEIGNVLRGERAAPKENQREDPANKGGGGL